MNIIENLLSACTCLTKTPDINYHKEYCNYKQSQEEIMQMQQWVKEAVQYLTSITGKWDYPEQMVEYCESLYEPYVEENPENPFNPKDAVDEDITYWG